MPFDRELIFSSYPWLRQRDLPMVIGDDLDALLSAIVLHHVLSWRLVGLYQGYQRVLHVGPAAGLRDAVWVDLDISQRDIRSIGHHILYDGPGRDEDAHRSNVNLNRLRGVTGASGNCTTRGACCGCGANTFRHKYPLGTVHFLLWLFELDLPSSPGLDGLYWHADSAWINGQSHKFARNVEDWVLSYVPSKMLVRTLGQIDTLQFETTIVRVPLALFKKAGFAAGNSQTESRHLKIHNWQCQFSDFETSPPQIQRFLDAVAKASEMTAPAIPQGPWQEIKGQRTSAPLSNVVANGDFASFVTRNGVFSYVIPNNGRINYTQHIRIP